VVDDEPGIRVLARIILERAGCAVLDAADACEALELVGKHDGHLDLLLTDIIMPGLDGAELAVRVRFLRPDIGVVYMSGGTGDTVIDEAIPMVAKPFTSERLTTAVRGVLAEQAQTRLLSAAT
jgi:CheY-like chemotaxis protein